MLTKKLLCAVLVMIIALPVMLLAANAEVQYIFPTSNTKHLTWDEVEAWNCNALLIGFNEIWARHGYVFKAGGACDRWFSQQDWYHPISSGTNEKNVLPKASQLEWDNYHLIKDVMAYKRAYGLENEGKKLPSPPQKIDLLSGFEYVDLKTGQKLDVYSAPSSNSWRGANGKASVSTNGRVYAYAKENNWMMIMYETNASENAVRVGWVNLSQVSGKVPSLPNASFGAVPMNVSQAIQVTDDPVGLTSMTTLPAGTQVTWLSSFYSNTYFWDYIEFTLNGQRARGFILSGILQTEDTDSDDWNNG